MKIEVGELLKSQVDPQLWGSLRAGTVLVEDGCGGYRLAHPSEIPADIAAMSEELRGTA